MGNMLDCPDGWSQKSDTSRYCWKLKKNAPGPRPDAKANCERDGAHLVTIYSEHDDAMVKNLMITGTLSRIKLSFIPDSVIGTLRQCPGCRCRLDWR